MFKRILVPLDGSAASTRALDTAIEMAKVHKSELYLFHVISVDLLAEYEPIPDGRLARAKTLLVKQYDESASSSDNPSEVEIFKDYKKSQGIAFLEDAKASIPEGIVVQTGAEVGVPKHAILEVAKRVEADLIVMGRHGLSAVERFFLGSVCTYAVANAECPVLVVK